MNVSPRPSSRGVICSWCLYDWANSAFTTLVVTFVYSTYFSEAFAEDPGHGTALWSRGIVISALLIALLAPFAGALADHGGKRRYLISCTLTCVIMTIALTFVRPTQPYAVATALSVFVIANVAFELGLVFYNAFLPSITVSDRIGRISGYGWGFGYGGGLACLALGLLFVLPDHPPPFGVSTVEGFNARATNILVGFWFLVFSLPAFWYLRGEKTLDGGFQIRQALKELSRTFHSLRRYDETFKFLIARLIYNDGLVTIFSFGGIYAAGTFGFDLFEVMVFGIVLNVVAGLGALIFGFVDDRVGGKATIAISLVALTVFTALAAVATNRTWFWIAGIGVGFFIGPNQSASRSLMGRFVPKQHESKFFGFFTFSGKATAFMGPWLLGILSDAYSQRVGVGSILLFFIVGGALLWRVDEKVGITAASP